MLSASTSALASDRVAPPARSGTSDPRHGSDRLRLALSAANLGDWDWDAATDIVTLSDRAAEMFGIPAGQTITWTAMRELLHPEDRERARVAVEQAIATQTDYDIEYRVVVGAAVRWILAKGRALYSDANTVVGMLGVVQDITDRKRTEQHVRDQRDVLEHIVAGTPLPEILQMMTDMVERYASRQLIASILLADADGKLLNPVAGRKCAPSYCEAIRNVPIAPNEGSCGSAAHAKTRVIVEDVSTHPFWQKYAGVALQHGLRACWSTPILSSSGKVLGTFAVYYTEPAAPTSEELEIIDVLARTASIAIDRKLSEEALRLSQEKLAHYAQELEQRVAERTAKLQETIGELEAFSYSVSHDMRAPLRAMQGYAEVLRQEFAGKLPKEANHFLTRIQDNAGRLELLVRDILTYSRVAKGEIRLQPIQLSRFLESLISQNPGFQLPHAKVELEPGLSNVLGHEAYLSQVFTNLIGNAVKFRREGVRPHVRISTSREGEFVKIVVADNGIGIEPAHFQRIFEIFGRVYPEQQFEGTGIGLSIAKKAVQRMGGTIGVESEIGVGSTFWFTLQPVP